MLTAASDSNRVERGKPCRRPAALWRAVGTVIFELGTLQGAWSRDAVTICILLGFFRRLAVPKGVTSRAGGRAKELVRGSRSC